ncbi:hypothetical protein BDQ17DRAFT_1187087, partial [Cyathus striatus]
GKWIESEKLERQVLDLRTRVLSEEHPDTIQSVANLAGVCSALGRWKEAETMKAWIHEMRDR